MSTEELVKSILEQHFSQYKTFHLVILLGVAIVQGIFIFIMSRNMEKFKALLKKSEIKFSRYHELQVEALRAGYQKLVLFNLANRSLLNSDYDTNDHNQYKLRINQWIKSYSDCISQLALEKMVLPKELKDAIEDTIADFHSVIDILIKERKYLDYAEEEGYGDWNIMYQYSDNELKVINEKINRLKSEDYIKKSTDNIKALRKQIEVHFEKMNQ